jgi:integrase
MRARFQKTARLLPEILSPDEVAALFRATSNLKHRALLMTLYAAGWRVSEVTHLRVSDIDRQRMVIRIEQGKGRQDRYVPTSPYLRDSPQRGRVQGRNNESVRINARDLRLCSGIKGNPAPRSGSGRPARLRCARGSDGGYLWGVSWSPRGGGPAPARASRHTEDAQLPRRGLGSSPPGRTGLPSSRAPFMSATLRAACRWGAWRSGGWSSDEARSRSTPGGGASS